MPLAPVSSPGDRKEAAMSDFDRNYAATRGFGADRAAALDQGLRAHMIRVYNYMAGGVALTGVVAWLAYQAAGGDAIVISRGFVSGATPFGQAIFARPLMWVLGLSLASVFVVYTQASLSRVFFISAASFGAMSLWGYTTQRSLDGMGSFMIMGLFGLMIAMLVNFFLQSSGLDWAISVIGVLVFAGLTAWDTQKIKDMYSPMDDGSIAGRKVVMGALTLYLDFINMFLFMLRLFGDRR